MGRVLAEHEWERNTPRAFTASNATNRFSDFMAREQGAGPSFNRLSPAGLEKHRGKRIEAQGNKSSTLADRDPVVPGEAPRQSIYAKPAGDGCLRATT